MAGLAPIPKGHPNELQRLPLLPSLQRFTEVKNTMCRKRVSASQGVIFCIFIFLLLVLNRISDDGRLSRKNLEKLYI
jgi:hypothetical protein